MTIIDAHQHCWDLQVRDQDWIAGPEMAVIRRNFSLDDLRPSADAAGVVATVLVQTVAVQAETPEMLSQAAADPLAAAVVGWTDLTSPAVADELARLKAGPAAATWPPSGTRFSPSRTRTGCGVPTSSAASGRSPPPACATTWSYDRTRSLPRPTRQRRYPA